MRISDWSSDVCSSDLRSSDRAPRYRTPSAEPAIRQVQAHLFAQPTLRTDPHAIAYDQHPDHQLRINRWPTRLAIIGPHMLAQVTPIHEPIDRPEEVIQIGRASWREKGCQYV